MIIGHLLKVTRIDNVIIKFVKSIQSVFSVMLVRLVAMIIVVRAVRIVRAERFVDHSCLYKVSKIKYLEDRLQFVHLVTKSETHGFHYTYLRRGLLISKISVRNNYCVTYNATYSDCTKKTQNAGQFE